MSSKAHSRQFISTSGLTLLILLAALVVAMVVLDQAAKSSTSKSGDKQVSADKVLAAKLVKGQTKAVVPSYGETISKYWVSSGAQAKGFDLTVYTKAVKKLNPDLNVNVFRDNITWKVPWPRGN